MKPFDLDAALDGAKLVTHDGNPARLICADRQHQARFIWLEQDEKGPEYVATGTYEALCQALRLADDEPVKQAQTPRPHAELIHAWADGAEIQYLHAGFWWLTDNPQWHEATQFRIKPNEPQWYENIPEHGVLCWVDDKDPALRERIRHVTKYPTAWRYVTPLTNDEIKQFLG